MDHDIVKLGSQAKALVKHYYGEAEEDYGIVKEKVESGLSRINTYGEEEWARFKEFFTK